MMKKMLPTKALICVWYDTKGEYYASQSNDMERKRCKHLSEKKKIIVDMRGRIHCTWHYQK